MDKILFSAFLIILFNTFAQTASIKNSTHPLSGIYEKANKGKENSLKYLKNLGEYGAAQDPYYLLYESLIDGNTQQAAVFFNILQNKPVLKQYPEKFVEYILSHYGVWKQKMQGNSFYEMLDLLATYYPIIFTEKIPNKELTFVHVLALRAQGRGEVMRLVLAIAAGALLSAAAPVKLAPADDKPALVGAAARHKQGPDPTVRPPADVGATEDPMTVPPTPPANAAQPK